MNQMLGGIQAQVAAVNDFSWVTPQLMEEMFHGVPAMVALMKHLYVRKKTRGNNSPHIGGVLEIFNLHALTANVRGSSMISDLVGGPSIH